MKRRVVVTGVGLVTPIGIGKEEFWKNLIAGKSGIGLITQFDTEGFDAKIAGEVKDFDFANYGDKKEAKEDKSIPHHDCGKKVFTRGDILVVNDNLAHYRGELEVVLTEIPNDGERNLIGKVKDEDLGLLDFIKPGQHFKFIK